MKKTLLVVIFFIAFITIVNAQLSPGSNFNLTDSLLAVNKVEEILIEGLPLGGLREEHFNILTRSFNSGDIIVQLSDGLPEAPNLVGEMYDYERLGQLIEINGSKSSQGMIDSLIASVDSWLQVKHNPDDITLVVIKKK